MKVRLAVLALGLPMSLPHLLVAQTQSLTLDHALQRARTRAPLILAARDRIEENEPQVSKAISIYRRRFGGNRHLP